MKNPETGPAPEQNVLTEEISKRASTASEKVKQRVTENTIPGMEKMGDYAQRWLSGMQIDFYTLVKNPKDQCGGGHYDDWTPDEIRELFFVLYGEELG